MNKYQEKYREAFTHMATDLPQQSKTPAKFLFRTSFNIFRIQIDNGRTATPRRAIEIQDEQSCVILRLALDTDT